MQQLHGDYAELEKKRDDYRNLAITDRRNYTKRKTLYNNIGIRYSNYFNEYNYA